jgi:hypothetical protein
MFPVTESERHKPAKAKTVARADQIAEEQREQSTSHASSKHLEKEVPVKTAASAASKHPRYKPNVTAGSNQDPEQTARVFEQWR